MKLLFLLLLMQIPTFADFRQASGHYQNKKYALAIDAAVEGVQSSFDSIIATTKDVAPYLNKARVTNVSYRVDFQSPKPYFSFRLSYPINHKNKGIVITLDYSFESVRYYQTYIQESQFYIPEGARYQLISIAKKPILWYPRDSVGHFVYSFSDANPKETGLVSGILLSIEFPKQISNQERNEIFEEMIQKISWKSLQDILSK